MKSSHIDDVVRVVVEGNYKRAVDLCEKAHRAGIEARDIITKGLSKGMVETALGGVVFAPLAHDLIEAFGWRTAYLVFGATRTSECSSG